MWISFKNKILKTIDSFEKSERLYIIPTFDGLKLLALNLTLLVIGLVYANNYVLFFNFILFCLFLGSMYYTHFNLQGLSLESAQLPPFHMKKHGTLTLSFKSKSNLGHYFLNLKFHHSHFKLDQMIEPFSFEPKSKKALVVHFPVSGLKRGEVFFEKICIETYFPFHLFKCFMYFNPQTVVVIYPEKKDLKIHVSEILLDEKPDNGDDYSIENFIAGDSLKRVLWKKLAQTNQWYSKKLIAPKLKPIVLSLDSKLTAPSLVENQLSSLTSELYLLHDDNVQYGLKLKNLYIPPSHSKIHLARCLHALAVYEY